MPEYFLSKAEKKTLRSMKGRSHVPSTQIHNCDRLLKLGLIARNYTQERDSFNALIPDGTYRLSEEYDRYLESKRWFTLQYVISSILVPIAVGVSSYIITRYLIGP